MTEIDIGGRAEEMLRDYFLESNCYVARGIKLRFGGTDVTDIDLWLYSRPSSFSRERTNVDAKYKQKPQAMERILWAKGVQAIIGTERCIVATTDKRPVVKSYAHEHGVVVLDGHFFSRLVRRASSEPSRWIEDDLLDALTDKSDKTLMELEDAGFRRQGQARHRPQLRWLQSLAGRHRGVPEGGSRVRAQVAPSPDCHT